MRYLVLCASVATLALIAAGAGGAAQAKQVSIAINDSFVDESVSEACGFEVTIDLVADLTVTLVYNRAGLVVREIDHFANGTITYSSAETGGSFSFPFQPATWDYGSGAVIGSEVIVSFVGLEGHATGFIDSDAGLVRVLGVVEGFDEFGIPLVDFSQAQVLADKGNRNSQEEVFDAICAALA
jgi:hypothetical protein